MAYIFTQNVNFFEQQDLGYIKNLTYTVIQSKLSNWWFHKCLNFKSAGIGKNFLVLKNLPLHAGGFKSYVTKTMIAFWTKDSAYV